MILKYRSMLIIEIGTPNTYLQYLQSVLILEHIIIFQIFIRI